MEDHFAFVCAAVGIWIFLCLEHAARVETLDFLGVDDCRNDSVFVSIATLANVKNAKQLEMYSMDGMQYAAGL